MSHTEDPTKQVGYLQQCYSSDKKPLGILLGAGCPLAIKSESENGAPLIPDVMGMTKTVCENLEQDPKSGPRLKIIEEQLKEDGNDNPNVEDILSHIRALRAAAGKKEARGLSAADLDALDEGICQVIQQLADKPLPHVVTPYHQLAAWIDAAERERPVEIFTTNYDLLMEQALEDRRVPFFDGFAGTYRPFFDIRAMEQDRLPSRWARLWKLHGSINWYQTEGRGVIRATANESGLRRVIHPSHLKYEESRRMPYLAMIDRLRAFLKQPTAVLVVCGYSFRDQHLNEVIVQGLQGTQTAVAFGLLFGMIAGYSGAARLASERPNLNLLAKDGAIISGRGAEWEEKDASAASDSTSWLKWKPREPAKPDSKCMAEFELGDFSIFGSFLYELIGDARQAAEARGAK